MARGKHTCKILKEIRRRIAEANDIELIISECHYKGDCLGTCPKCEAEVRYLEEQLRARSLAGKAVALAGLSAGMIFLSGCTNSSSTEAVQTQGDTTAVDFPGEPVELVDTTVSETAAPKDTLSLMTVKMGMTPECIDTIGPSAEEPKQDEIDGDDIVAVVGIGAEVIVEDKSQRGIDYDKVFQVVEENPTFPGGNGALIKSVNFTRDLSKYDMSNVRNFDGKRYRVVVQFVIDTVGGIGEIKILRGQEADQRLLDECIERVRALPRFTPGKMDGRKVKVWYTVPIMITDVKGK